jgi:alkylhydroperoxidase domain protein
VSEIIDRTPRVFTTAQLGWQAWVEPLPESELTAAHIKALVDAARAKSPYFRLLARDPAALEARTRLDKDIFYAADRSLPRAERELAAAAASRLNGCIYCASVHARFAASTSQRGEDVQRLLAEGVDADFGPRWNAIVGAARRLPARRPRSGRRISRSFARSG